ncbi:TetR/AcrR family transcriptional regulator [Allokutzneria albata]|uniref:Regulatory protein, tetR family n=1 Tax=Allokutzneria albata TaxID=211114 RepID=A0A1G9R9J5_ALLAB|nr:TetR/AcrR family transcriptional regulator [Allokutzneria albata]SDM19898.1 regulatory protein, tetR family [Allokutzneria albata]
MARASDTRQRIQAVARDLFRRKGVQKTSLQAIAAELGITKPALYYHFASREELVRSIVQPLIEDGEAFLLRQEKLAEVDQRALLEGYFDFHFEHRDLIVLVLTEMTTLAELGMIEIVLTWRQRLAELLFPPSPSLAESARAVVALGGLQDCTIQFPHVPREQLRKAAVDAAHAALTQ